MVRAVASRTFQLATRVEVSTITPTANVTTNVHLYNYII